MEMVTFACFATVVFHVLCFLCISTIAIFCPVSTIAFLIITLSCRSTCGSICRKNQLFIVRICKYGIANAIEHKKSGLAWETENELTGRKDTNRGRIRAKSPEVVLRNGKATS